jgi:pimeloyl-ACP methyl ester carboxylesterase
MAMPAAPDVRTIPTPHGAVRVRDTGGSGTPVLLLHALLTDPDLYAPLLPLLDGRRCLVPELPLGAHGVPLAPGADLTPPGLVALLVSVLDELAVPRVHLVGVDTGGALAQLLMAAHPDRVGSVVLTACDAYEEFPPGSMRAVLAPLRLPGMLWLVGQSARLGPGRRLGSIRRFTHAGVDDATLRRWTRPLRDRAVRRDLRAVLAGIGPEHTLAAARANAAFPRPVLVAWGEDDRVFPRRLGERLAAELPDAALVTLPDCAAFASVDQPELLAKHIDAHLGPAD